MNRSRLSFVFLISIVFGYAAMLPAETLQRGSAFPEINSTDQHDVPYRIPSGTHYVAVSFTMSAGKKANKYFEDKGKGFLPENKAVYIANIYGMPGVARVFAMPKMRKYPHRIMLADEKDLLDPFPQEDGLITVFELGQNFEIISISYWDPSSGENPFN